MDQPKKVKFVFKKKRGSGKPTGDRKPDSRKPDTKFKAAAQTVARGMEETRRELGAFRATKEGGRIEPANKKARAEYAVPRKWVGEAQDGELVLVEIQPRNSRLGLQEAKIIERIGRADDPRAYSILAIFENEIPVDFPAAATAQAEEAKPTGLGKAPYKRVDLRKVPLITIDGEDARDFDDAVFAEPDPENPGGWHLLVAIADVAHYVTPGSPLDLEAYQRGNSVYFTDRVVPMLPEALSNELCSLKPEVERATMAVHLWINADGQLTAFEFVRGLMRSHARLTYNQVQAAYDGTPDKLTQQLQKPVLDNLFAVYAILRKARKKRGTLELDVPEYKAHLEGGKVARIERRTSGEANQLIEEFMILANVAAASALETKGGLAIYRIHDEPPEEKREALAEFLKSLGGSLPKGNKLTSSGLARILDKYRDTAEGPLVNEMMLRSQSRAAYSPDNIGHFGLALPRYAHFTSPIRRYADLLIHRALIRAYNLGDDGLPDAQAKTLAETGLHLGVTEHRAAMAERQTTERYVAAYLASQIGAELAATVSGVTSFGLFVRLTDSGADGLIPMRDLGGSQGSDFFTHDEGAQALVGRRTGVSYRLGQKLRVRLDAADGLSGRLQLAIVGEGAASNGQRQGQRQGQRTGQNSGQRSTQRQGRDDRSGPRSDQRTGQRSSRGSGSKSKPTGDKPASNDAPKGGGGAGQGKPRRRR